MSKIKPLMKKTFLLPFLLFIFTQSSPAQHIARCAQQQAMNQFEKKYPGFQKAINQTFDTAKKEATQNAHRSSGVVHQVQVVVHVVYNTEEQNISEELIHSQIAVLNEDFRRMNADAENAREMYKQLGGDAEIEFVLADIDPEGNPTNGITRTQTEVKSFMDISIGFEEMLTAAEECNIDITNLFDIPDSAMACLTEVLLEGGFEENEGNPDAIQLDDVKRTAKGGQDPWDTERYINIWVTNLNMDFLGEETPALLGFAYPPVGAPNWPDEVFEEDLSEVDGVVVHHQAFGRDNPNSGVLGDLGDGGRTCTHEMGHYFGLRHIHGDGDCEADDGISDTPVADANQQAQADPNNIPVCEELHTIDTCPEDDLPDMVENYMDYNAITCQNLFTKEQVGIMKAMLEGPRSGLLQNITSTESVLANEALNIYPNPSSGTINIALKGYDLTAFEVQVQNILGTPVNVHLSKNKRILNVSTLEKGIYLLNLQKGGLKISRKISVL
jgi:hypothetical protein